MDTSGIIGQSPVMQDVFRVLARVAPTDTTVLTTGEPGTGKELLARTLHKNSRRASRPFVSINCRTIPGEFLEPEIFGHEKGALINTTNSGQGRVALADGGTVFFNGIGLLGSDLQVKLLRLLQDKELVRMGGISPQKVNVRVIASSSINLEKEVEQGNFREDLFYRLNVIPIALPPLRARGGDVLLLAEFFLKKFREKSKESLFISQKARKLMMIYSWPGNVRELENIMKRAAVLCEGPEIEAEHLPDNILSAGDIEQPVEPVVPGGYEWPKLRDMRDRKMNLKEYLEKIEENLLMEAINKSDGVKNQAAEILGIKRTTLIEKLKKKSLI